MIIWAGVFVLVVVVAAFGFKAIEKKRDANGMLVYPLWRCNFLLLWIVFTLLCAVIVGSLSLPKFVGLVMHNKEAQATVMGIKVDEPCRALYSYKIGEASYSDTESLCGLKIGDVRTIYYDTSDLASSSLYQPALALRDEVSAIALISVLIGAFMVLWFRATHIIGKRDRIKP
jgi:hypothetical protein